MFITEGATQLFMDEGYAKQLLQRITENQEDRQVLATLLFTLADFMDSDESGSDSSLGAPFDLFLPCLTPLWPFV